MNHDFDNLVISIGGICNKCKKQLVNHHMMSRNDIRLLTYPSEVVRYQAGRLYEELDKHECIIDQEPPKDISDTLTLDNT